MKTFLLATLFISTSLIAEAQFTEPGQRIIGGTINFNTSNNANNYNPGYESKGNDFGLSIIAGKFVKKNVLSSVGLSFNNAISKRITPTDTTKNNIYAFSGSYSSTYFKEIAKRFYFGIRGSFGLSYSSYKISETQVSNRSKSDGYQASLGIAPVLSYQLTDRFVFNLSPSADFLNLNYNYSKIKYAQPNQPTQTGKSSSFNFSAGFFSAPLSNLSFGFSYLLKHKLIK